MEVTKDDAQKLVRNEGMKTGRCGFWVVRKMVERYNPRSYMKLLKLLMNIVKPNEAKTVRNVQSAIEDWETNAELFSKTEGKVTDKIRPMQVKSRPGSEVQPCQ